MRGPRVGDSLLLLSAYIGRAGTQALLLWAFAQAGGPAGVGEFALAFAVSTPVVIGFELALRYVLQTLQDAPGFRVFFLLRMLCALIAVLLVATVGAVGLITVSFSVLVPLLSLKFADSVLDICLAQLQAQGRHQRTASVIWTNTVLTIAAIFGTLASGAAPEWAVVGSAFASVAILSLVAPGLLKAAKGPWIAARSHINRVLRSGIALGVAQTLVAALTYLPVLFLAVAADKSAVGVFAVCQYAVTFANLFYASAAQTWVSDLRSAFMQQGHAGLLSQGGRVAAYLVGVGSVAGLCTMLLPAIVPPIFGAEFAVDLFVALPFALAVFVLSIESTLFVVLVVLNRYTSRATSAATGVAVTTIAGLVALPQASVLVAGYLVLIGISARCAVSLWNLHTALRRG